jgi:parallel beta-helix repeat protein
MLAKKALLISVILSLFVCGKSMAVMCARLKAVSAGEWHTLALMDDNSLWACGDNSSYECGLGSGINHSYSLKQVLGENGEGFLQNIVAFDAGWYHSLAADSDGVCFSWGKNTSGQLGRPGITYLDVPYRVNGFGDLGADTKVVYVSAGRSGEHSLIVDSNGYAYAFGLNDYHQCGDESSDSQKDTPVLVHDDDPNTTGVYLGDIAHIVAVDAGVHHSLALSQLSSAGYVWEWGGNNSSSYPRKVPGPNNVGYLHNIVGISTCYHSVAVDSNGFVYEWEYWNPDNPNPSDCPHRVPGGAMGTTYLQDVCEVSAGGGGDVWFSLARTSDGHVLIWSYGQEPQYVPAGEMNTQSGLLEGIISIAAGYYNHKLAVSEDGSGWAWGTNNSYGKFGVGDTDPHPKPTQMLCAEVSSSIYLTKTSEIQGTEPNCVRPFIGMGLDDNYLVYYIDYGNPITDPNDPNYYGTVHEVNIIDHLPLEVDFYSASDPCVYDGNERTVRWTIGDLEPGEEGSLTLTVKVNKYARPGGQVSNFAEMIADKYYSYATDSVPVCNWGSEIIYVDKDANGFNNGTSWDDAYIDLRDAFTGAQNIGAEITAIWVAAGTYKPTYDANETDYENKSFELLENVGLFGHFGGVGTYETSTSQRNFVDLNNETILEGQIGENYYDAVRNVVAGEDIISAVVDGFTIQGGYAGSGIYLNNSNVSIVNCTLKNNVDKGVYAYNYSYPDIHNCLFADNSYYAVYSDTSEPDISYTILDGDSTTTYGLYLRSGSASNVTHCDFKKHTSRAIYGSYATVDIEDCRLYRNGYHGVEGSTLNLTAARNVFEGNGRNGVNLSSSSTLDIRNCVIRNSGYQGIYLYQNSATKIINCWIHNNGTAMNASYGSGIYFENQVGIPLVRNDTIYDNYTYGIECSQTGADPNIRNCIISGNDSNDLYRVNGSFNKVNHCLLQNIHSGTGNRIGDPGFINPAEANDLHLAETSQCKDAGDPNFTPDPGETDIDSEDRMRYGRVDIGADEYYWPKADYDRDEIVNFIDYSSFASSWRADEPNISLDTDNDVDTDDLALFCLAWLWQAPWADGWMMTMGRSGPGLGSAVSLDSLQVASATKPSDALMLSAAQSLQNMPQRLRAKTQKFYDITPQTTVSAMQKQLAAIKRPADAQIKEILDWLDETWLSGDLDQAVTYDQYIAFREALLLFTQQDY